MVLVSRIKRILLSLLVLILTIAVLLLLYEKLQEVLADRNYQRPGRLVDVGGHKLHALLRGEIAPTVVFESGLGIDGHLSWYKGQGPVSEFARTISYDRAGVLWSDHHVQISEPELVVEAIRGLVRQYQESS
tara:strand:+ start:250 stop:645 length:396 start_codon:yes stop_codon:yes gene_type:complete